MMPSSNFMETIMEEFDFSKMERNSFSGNEKFPKTLTIDSIPSREILTDAQADVLGTVERYKSTRKMKKRIEQWMVRHNSTSTAPSRTILHVAIKLANGSEDFSANERLNILRVINREYWFEREVLTVTESAILMLLIRKVKNES